MLSRKQKQTTQRKLLAGPPTSQGQEEKRKTKNQHAMQGDSAVRLRSEEHTSELQSLV